MKDKLTKIFNKKGFTLIELLVVIGILAVLAAIAIPTVAGLIDRANKSADLTNSNEMTNALERFASEYELYKNDIAMGIVPNDDLDTMQGRVYAVTGATTRAEITELETAGNDGTILINDERYPTNDALVKKIVETYTKTSSSTFEPKQSDKCFWYSPECGLVVVAEHNSTVSAKNELVANGKDAKGNDLTPSTQWIDLTDTGSVESEDESISVEMLDATDMIDQSSFNSADPDVLVFRSSAPFNTFVEVKVDGITTSSSNYAVSEGSTVVTFTKEYSMTLARGEHEVEIVSSIGSAKATFDVKNLLPINSSYTVASTSETLVGDGVSVEFPLQVSDGDIYKYNDYKYTYQNVNNGWKINYTGTSSQPADMLSVINGQPVVNLTAVFSNNTTITKSPKISTNAVYMSSLFQGCTALTDISNLVVPSSAVEITTMFKGCVLLTTAPDLSNCTNLVDISNAFNGCTSLTTAPTIPENVKVMTASFMNCTSLTGTVVINTSPVQYNNCFRNVDFAKQNIALTGSSDILDVIGATGIDYCADCDGTCKGAH